MPPAYYYRRNLILHLYSGFCGFQQKIRVILNFEQVFHINIEYDLTLFLTTKKFIFLENGAPFHCLIHLKKLIRPRDYRDKRKGYSGNYAGEFALAIFTPEFSLMLSIRNISQTTE